MPLFQEILTFSSLNFVPTEKHRCINKPYILLDRKNLYIPVWSSAGTGPILQHRTTSAGITGEIKHGIVFEQNRKLIILLSIEHNDKHSLALIDGITGDLLQSFEISYAVVYMTLVYEANGMFATILTCGIDRKIHRYTIDNKCTIRRSKKKGRSSSNWLYRLLSHHMVEYDPLTVDALPMRILIKDYLLVIGYSNGLLDWIMLEQPQPQRPTDMLSEIPAFRGNHSSEGVNIGIAGNNSLSPSRTDSLKRSKSDSTLIQMGMNAIDTSPTRTLSEKEELLASSSHLTTTPLPLELTTSKLIIPDEMIIEEDDDDDDDDDDDEDDDEEQDKVIFDDIQQAPDKKDEETLENNPECENTSLPAVEVVISPAPIQKKLLFDGAICAMSFYRLPYQIDGLIVAMASGAVAIVSLSLNKEWSLEQPLAILPGSYQHGGALAITTATVSYTNQYDDIFIGYEDGTILLSVCESMIRHESIHSSSLELNFIITWSIQMNFPIRYLEYGQMMDVTETADQPMSETTLIADQLVVVTTRSFHVFQLSIPNRSNVVDQLINSLSIS